MGAFPAPGTKLSTFAPRPSILRYRLKLPHSSPYLLPGPLPNKRSLLQSICLLRRKQQKTNHRAPSSQDPASVFAPDDDDDDGGIQDEHAALSAALKLEELGAIMTKLSPGNLKRATDDFLAEWERSLGAAAVTVRAGGKDKAC